mmetsp:Transcript_54130/g.127198  ORF Transcript_54130/g.127198 Transcript_54130/m.127198 type:complete len:459 (-) Transcript_54130:23-1399(-)
MAAAVDDVEGRHRHYELVGALAGDLGNVLIERHAASSRTSTAHSHGHSQNCVGTNFGLAPSPLVLRSIDLFDHHLVNLGLVGDVHAQELWSENIVDVCNGLQYTLSQQTTFVTVSKLQGFVNSSRSSTGNGCTEQGSPSAEVHFDGGVSSRIEDFPGFDSHDRLRVRSSSTCWSRHFGLILYSFCRGFDLIKITQVFSELERCDRVGACDWLQVRVQAVHERATSGDFKACDVVIGDALQELEDCPDRISVGGDENSFAFLQLWGNRRFPERHHTGNRVLEALCFGDVRLVQSGVLLLLCRVELAVVVDWWRRHIEAASPDLDLIGAVLLHCLLLIQACKAAVHALVESPALFHGNKQLISILQRQITCLDGTFQVGSEGHIHLNALRLQQAAGAFGFAKALCGQVDIYPSGEPVVHVPLGLSMPRENQSSVWLCHGTRDSGERQRRCKNLQMLSVSP